MLLNGDMHKMRVIENIFELHRAFTASTCFDFCSFCSLFFCRARRLTLIRIRILIHIQFFIVVAFVAFCFATRYVSCFANQHPPSPCPDSLPAPLFPSSICSSMKMKGRGKSQLSQRNLLSLRRWRQGERGRRREQRALVFDCQSHAI